jgi:hypothetical protein
MPVNPGKPRIILIVHGVQLGADKDQKQDQQIKELVQSRIGNLPLSYRARLYRYEDLNDKAIKPARDLMKLLGKTPVATTLAAGVMDIVMDVVISLAEGSTAAKIREGLRRQILDIHAAGHPCYIVAHSLGSIYTLDVINELMRQDDVFERNSRRTWPVQGLLTIGSPIGLHMFRKSRNKLANLGHGNKIFRWLNYWDPTDPVVSGNIFGKKLTTLEIARSYMNGDPNQGWHIRDIPTDSGKRWLLAHTAYWEDAKVGDGLVDLVAN